MAPKILRSFGPKPLRHNDPASTLTIRMIQVELPKDFFTLASLGTFAGATTATYVVASTIQHAFSFNPKWLALLIAEIVCLAGVALVGGAGADYGVAVLNGCLVYCTVVGVNEVSGKSSPTTVDRGVQRRTFRTRWWE